MEHLAIPTIPVQTWNSVYEVKDALREGTIFPDLNLPFFAAEDANGIKEDSFHSISENADAQKRRETLMLKIQQISFYMDDLRLYLDTHPDDSGRAEDIKEAGGIRRELLKDFARECYPLTFDCMAELYGQSPYPAKYVWQDGPMPWEGACV